MIVQVVRFKSGLSKEDVRRAMDERMHGYRGLSGLVQKYYIQDEQTQEYGGVYVWDDEQAMLDFRDSALADTIRDTYRIEGDSWVDTFEVMAVLRAPQAAIAR